MSYKGVCGETCYVLVVNAEGKENAKLVVKAEGKENARE